MPPYHRPVAPCDYGAGDYRYAAAFFQLQQQRIRIKGLIRKQRRKFFSLYQRCYLADVIPLSRHQLEINQVPQRIHHRQYLRGHPAFGLAYGLILGPPFAPCPWR